MALIWSKAKRYCAAFVVFMILSVASCVSAATPTSEVEIPLIPGSTNDAQATAVWAEDNLYADMPLSIDGAELPLESEYHAFYTTKAPLEDVVRYYAMKLGAQEVPYVDIDLSDLAPGQSTPVYMEFERYEWQFEDEYDEDGKLWRSGKLVRESLAKNRMPYSAGSWLAGAFVRWGYMSPDNEMTLFEIVCEDRSFSEDYRQFLGVKTAVAIHRYTYMSEEAAWDFEDEASSAEIKNTAKKMSLSPPTSASLGIPLYPGAEFLPEASAGMSMSDMVMYIYVSADTPAQVINWYQQATGKKAESWEKNNYIIALSGELPFPEKGLSVQPNIVFGEQWKTVITFAIAGGSSDD